MKKVVSVFLALIMLLSLAACGSKQDDKQEGAPVELKLSKSTPADNPVSEALTYLSETVNEQSGGNVQIKVYFDAALGSEPESIEGLKLGTVDMARVATANMASFVPELDLFNLPFLFRDSDHFWNVLNGEVGNYIKEKFEENGFKLLAYYEDGARNVYDAKKFIETADDFKGVKIRTMTSTLITEAFEAMGAAPTPMNFGELYTSLQQGVVEAGENNFSTIYTSKQYEVAPYITETEHYRIPSVLIMSLDKWNSLSAEQQDYLQKAADASREWEIPHFIEADQSYRQMLVDAGVKIQDFSDSEKEILLDKLADVYAKCNEAVGNDLVNKIIATK